MNKERQSSVFSDFRPKELDFEKDKTGSIFEPLIDKDNLEIRDGYTTSNFHNSELINLKNEKLPNKTSSFQ